MSSHPINLGLRFLMEIAALIILGMWGWHTGQGGLQYVLAIGLPIAAAAIWGIFRVPNDPGPAIVATPGWFRLLYELALFGFTTWALFDLGRTTAGWVFGAVFVLHYLTSYDRIQWMVNQ